MRGIALQPPTATVDLKGNLVTTSAGIEALTMEVFRKRLSSHKVKKNLKVHHLQREELFEQRFNEAQQNKTPPWTIEELTIVLKQLKNIKSRDPMGLTNELFKPENAGDDLKLAIKSNQMKSQQVFPEPLKLSNITSLYKNKGSKKRF